MTRANVLREVRQIRFEELYKRRHRGTFTAAGLQDRWIGLGSARALPVDEALRMVTLYETRSTGWTVTHFHER